MYFDNGLRDLLSEKFYISGIIFGKLIYQLVFDYFFLICTLQLELLIIIISSSYSYSHLYMLYNKQ